MKISKDTVVQMHYTLSDSDGQQIESTRDGDAVAYLQGHGNMIPGFEKAVDGHEAGESFSFELAPEDAYGPAREPQIARVPVKHLQGSKKWRKGMVAWVQTEHGTRQVTVEKVGKFMADVDTNHPLAGKTLKFDVEIVAVRVAMPEEISHGHAHGPGGHHHH
tara:strand:+ start:93 stop:578 length:486 start_codon:yes stop_codon:yes gene_type:complete